MKKQNLLIIASLVLIPTSVLAICQGPLVPCSGAECGLEDIFVLIRNVLNFVLTCLAPIFGTLLLIIGGIYFLFAGPDPEMIEKGKKAITAVIIGLLIIYLAEALLNTLLKTIGAGGV